MINKAIPLVLSMFVLGGCQTLQQNTASSGSGCRLSGAGSSCAAQEVQQLLHIQRQLNAMTYVERERWLKKQGQKQPWPAPVLAVVAYTSTDATLEQRQKVAGLMQKLSPNLSYDSRSLLNLMSESNQQQLALIRMLQKSQKNNDQLQSQISDLEGKIKALTAIEEKLAPNEAVGSGNTKP
ncbi:hypothetical protein WH50_01980 [Pokkaliibacter plantistimulans]|uniref:Lipoprotein n=1 Tax=Pokkaliibacter plantistimulans TaxID=1635171 RepID=A0ABX5M1Y5_9GAMM|nr:hypothetical protein [Pokkaliibacter plantistimulans]PXF32936.1 hypothetical protein WH50_01980 [Pokkaliibacter plantistimulans]